MPLPPPLQQIVSFLRAGYPEGVPPQDYLPILALLGRDFSPEDAPPEEVDRVRRRLAAAGWDGEGQPLRQAE